MDNLKFRQACDKIIREERARNGIGTLGEKTLHAVLKAYLEEDMNYHEIKVGGYYADICRAHDIIEIQTAGFNRLRDKLNAFLPDYRVTVVYPIPQIKYLSWIDEESGEITEKESKRDPALRRLFRVVQNKAPASSSESPDPSYDAGTGGIPLLKRLQ